MSLISCRSVAARLAAFAAIVLGLTRVGQPVLAADLPLATKAPAPAAGNFWADVEYLAWTVKGDKLPPLVTSSPAGTILSQAGVLGFPGTSVLFGDSSVNDRWRSGLRARVGYWLDAQKSRGVEGGAFGLEQASTGFNAASGGSPILARPFFDAVLNQQSSSVIAFPGVVAGSVNVSEALRLYGADALYRQQIGSWGAERVSVLAGYRYLHASDDLGISTSSTVTAIAGPIPVGTIVGVSDSFKTRSNFHGAELGLIGDFAQGPWTLEWRAKVSLGVNINSAEIAGATTVNTGGVVSFLPGGLLALSSNSGNFSETRFAVVPELALKAGYRFAPGWQLVGGYDLLYWTGVQRAGNALDTAINPNLVPPGTGPGPQRPQFQFNASPLLAQGFSVGVRYEFAGR
jgi:putative beta barrel porin BBP7